MKISTSSIFRSSIFLFIQTVSISVYANNVDNQFINDTLYVNGDSIHLIGSIYNNNPKLKSSIDDSIENELLDSSRNNLKNDFDQNALAHFAQSDKIRSDIHNKKIVKRIYGKLAKIFAKKKYYPVAMQYYYKTLSDSDRQNNIVGTGQENDIVSTGFNNAGSNVFNQMVADTDNYLNTKFLSDSFQENYFNNNRLLFLQRKGVENNSPPIENYSVLNAFNNGKYALAYAVIIHVKQPESGKRKAFTGINNVGHTFITLLKYDSDSTCIYHSFGFYPKKDNFFSATPLHPASSSVFKDDAVHDWDEVVGKFISERRFKKLIKLISKFSDKKYDLNSNNCTDFGLYAAEVAGISIANTAGTWPLGHGNNPANAGQSILEGKFINTDTGTTQGLFICAEAK